MILYPLHREVGILLELLDFAIDAEYIKFWDDGGSPYFDGDGTRLDEL